MSSDLRVAVLGAGVSGLTCAHELASRFATTVYYADPPMATTSAIATAIWHVYLVDPNDNAVLRWSTQTLQQLLRIGEKSPEAAVYPVRGTELFRTSVPEQPTWAGIPPYFKMMTAAEIERYEGVSWGYHIEAPLAEMVKYLPWLRGQVESRGVPILQRRVESIEELFDVADVVVNCTGLGARELCGDTEMVAVRGQWVLLDVDSMTPQAYIGDDDHPSGMSYMIPRRDGVCVGGTEEHGLEDLTFDIDVSELIRRAAETSPWLQNKTAKDVIARFVGLRPFRPSGVRLEVEESRSGPIVHNYGHGGSGFSLSWGCANDVVGLVSAEAERTASK